MNGLAPILVVFENKEVKEDLWSMLSIKMRDNVMEGKENLIVTQVSD